MFAFACSQAAPPEPEGIQKAMSKSKPVPNCTARRKASVVSIRIVVEKATPDCDRIASDQSVIYPPFLRAFDERQEGKAAVRERLKKSDDKK